MADPGQSSDVHPTVVQDEGGTVEIKIKTLDAQSYSLRVDKNTPVPALKDQIASVVGIPVENQRLICRGKVLKDDQVLAAYNVEDGHTLHLVARQPPHASPAFGQEQAAGTAVASDIVVVSPRTTPHLSHSVLMGTINIPDTAEGGMPDLNRIISAVLSSVGIGNATPGPRGAGPGGSVAVGVLPSRGRDGQPRAEGADARHLEGPPLAEQSESIDDIEAQLQLDAIYGVHAPGTFAGTGPALPSNPFHIMQSLPTVVPDALTTMSQYLDRLEQSFSLIERARGRNAQEPSTSDSVTRSQGNRPVGQTSEARLGRSVSPGAPSSSSGPSLQRSSNVAAVSGRQGTGGTAGPVAPPQRLPTPSPLGTIVNRMQRLLSDQAGPSLSRLAAQLENEPNVVDLLARDELQRTAWHDGNMMQQLGALLLELGRTTLTMRLGQSPADSVVNAGPAVFISPLGPNPMMVQSLPSQAGVALGALPPGPSQASGGHVGPSFGPRSINIHIHTSDLRLPSPSPSGTPSPQQPPPRAVIGLTSGAPSLTVRQMVERGDAAASPEHALTVRQIIERAEAGSGVQQGPAESNSHITSGGAVQGAIMTFNENGAMRVVPVRTRTAPVPGAPHPHAVNDGDAILQPLLARFQQHLGSAQLGRPGSTPTAGSGAASTLTPGATPTGDHPAPVPSVRAQVHIQAWAPSVIHAMGGAPSQHGSGSAPTNDEAPPPPVTGQGTYGTAESHRDSTVPTPAGPLSDSPAVQTADGVAQGVDVTQIMDSLGPFLNQLAAVFQQARPRPSDQRPSQQAMEQQPSALQPNVDSSLVNASVAAVPVEVNVASEQSLGAPVVGPVEQPGRGPDVKSDDLMDTTNAAEIAVGHADPGTESGSTSAGLVGEHFDDVDRPPKNGSAVEAQVEESDRPASPIGLGVEGLQPLPTRSRRRLPSSPRQLQITDVGAAAAAGNGLQPSAMEQALSGTGQNLSQNLSTETDRSSHRSEGSFREQLLGQVTEGVLLPLRDSVRSHGNAQDEEGSRELGDIMGQLMSRTSEGTVGGQGVVLGDMLRGVMGQLVQSPVMENLAQQVMTGMQNGDASDTQNALVGLGNRGRENTPGFDFSSIVNQMLPVVSQMFGSRPPSAGQQVPPSGTVRSHHEDGAARDIPGSISNSERWREALSEEEAMSWSETISADVEQQQTMESQRPFSDVYVRGSPLAKRQKTELEGATAQKLENGGPPEDIMRSLPYVEENNSRATNSDGVDQLGQQGAADGMADAYMAVLFHDLAARVAADPDSGDDSRHSDATGVFEQQ